MVKRVNKLPPIRNRGTARFGPIATSTAIIIAMIKPVCRRVGAINMLLALSSCLVLVLVLGIASGRVIITA